ncbi:MAG: imidazole glycerol phosphate synthase subunit HisH [Alkaliphilus sp.]|nr:imidazole glycerol phosphate synthase subunit HisH [bacterium AH-315-L21]PHS34857.1 MAG: imidazole glycerol phosphate synthase subunit HisH [Alkaliphilus sp.]
MIVIIDYGVGNILNVKNGFERIGLKPILTDDPVLILQADLAILPGVGAFNAAMHQLKSRGLDEVIIQRANSGKPIVGICLGMQLLFETSYENEETKGLGLLKGIIVPFKTRLKVPHMGWNKLFHQKNDLINQKLPSDPFVYFVHSYYLKNFDETDLVSYTEYDVKVPAIVRKHNIVGMQFHPEKSGEIGQQLLKNLKELI